MALNSTQLVVLKSDIDANSGPGGDLENAILNGDNTFIVDYYNNNASPDFWIFRDFISDMEMKDKGIDWTEHLLLTDIELMVFDKMLSGGGLEPSSVNVRNGLQAIFSGPQQVVTRNNILALAVKLATRVQKLFAIIATGPAGGNGGTNTTAAIAVFSGSVNLDDIREALVL